MQILIHHPAGMTPSEIYDQLDPAYKKERQCSPERLDGHLMSMKGVGIVEATDAFQDDHGQTVVRYSFTDYGLDTAKKYFPSLLN
ncbi:MAG: hypothetical protein IJT62_06635 [Oscillospiraceae bacterium]|nr:hypothetical protein [Oscillospiraceae bacterium]